MCIFFNDTATTEIYTLSLHDALPISSRNVYLNSEERISALSLSKAIFTAQEKVKVGMQTAPILSEMKNIIEATPHTKIDYVEAVDLDTFRETDTIRSEERRVGKECRSRWST